MNTHTPITPPVRTLVCTAALALLAGHAGGQCTPTKLMHADRNDFDRLGSAMSMSSSATGPMVAVGMPQDDHAGGAGAGSVRFFLRLNNQWGEGNWLTLTANDAAAADHFGSSVSYRDPYLIVGAPDAGTSGAAYIYQRGGSQWFLEGKIITPGAVAGDLVGDAVAVTANASGAWAMVAAPSADFDGSPNAGNSDPNAGAVYFYRRLGNGTWQHTQTVKDASTGVSAYFAADDHFGAAVDMSGDVAVVGIPDGENINWPDNHGYIHTYRRSATNVWENDNSILYVAPGSIQADDHFGAAVSTDGTGIAIGAPDDDASPGEIDVGSSAKTNSGCVYFRRYSNGSWSWDGKIMPPDASDNARFGAKVSLSGDECLIAAPGARKAYRYKRIGSSAWVLMNTIQDPDDGFSAFASCVAFDGNWSVIGDDFDAGNGVAAGGAIYVTSPPSTYGDSCSAAVDIGPGAHYGCTTLAQADSITTCGGTGPNGNGPDVWFRFIADCAGPVTLDTIGSSFDTVLSVHWGCPGNGGSATIECDDDDGPGTTSLINMTVTANTYYYVRIGGYNGASGNFTLNINYDNAPANDTCSTPTLVSGGNVYPFSTCRANTTPGLVASCPSGATVNDVWFRFNAPAATGTLKLNLCDSNFDTVVTLYNTASCPTAANEIGCNDDTPVGAPCYGNGTSYLSKSIQGGFPYMIRVAGYSTTSPIGDGLLGVSYIPNCHCDWNASGALTVQDIFDFLAAYFSGAGDFNANGSTTVQDVFDFLACYFSGCP